MEFKQAVALEEGAEAEAGTRLHLEVINEEVLIRGAIEAHMDLECSRCLKKYGSDLKIPLDLACAEAPEAVEGEEEDVELADDDLDTCYYREGVIDLGELIREQVLLAAPMKPLCSDTCKGLCPRCGQDLNEKNCGCEIKQIDPRLQALEKLLSKKERSKDG